MFEGFESTVVDTDKVPIFIRRGGKGPPLLLLHGFPETHLMWHRVAPVLAQRFSVICADLRGYGASGKPQSRPDHSPHAKRAMALDIIPTSDAFARADARFALVFWPWALLAQPAPLPEALIAGAPEAVIDDALSNWGSDAAAFPAEVRAAYVAALTDRASIHAICEEYRAAATLDVEHDNEDRQAGRHIDCPLLALWSAGSALDTWYRDIGGPLTVWRNWSQDAKGRPIAGGHFFAEQNAAQTAAELLQFFA